MPLSYVTYTANGSTNQFDITFSYIEQSHVKVYVNNVEDTNFTFVNSTRIQTNSTPTNGQVVKIDRVTPTSARLVDFADGSVLTESDLDKSANQNFFIAQETTDDVADKLGKANDGIYDATSTRIKNVANPTSAQDAVTKNYLENPDDIYSYINNLQSSISSKDLYDKFLIQYQRHFLTNIICSHTDKANMLNSIEARSPFLDHELIEWSWSVPLDMKFRNGNSKWILRKVLSKYIPTNLTERPKMGFSVPIEEWLKYDLKEWAESLLSKDSIDKQGFFDSKKVEKLWSEHKSGHRRFHAQLWSILMASSWAENNL